MAKHGRKFQIKTAKNGEQYFLLIAGNGEVLMQSETYKTGRALWKTLNTLIGVKLPLKIEEIE